jgi:hypothetical protein
MPTRHRRLAHEGLSKRDKRLGEARAAEREAEAALLRAKRTLEAARDRVRECHDLGRDPTRAIEELERGKRNVEHAQLAREGVAQRVRRAEVEREQYLETNAERLLEELRPECEHAADDLRKRAECVIEADQRWTDLARSLSRSARPRRTGRFGTSDATSGCGSSMCAATANELRPPLRGRRKGQPAAPGPAVRSRAASGVGGGHTRRRQLASSGAGSGVRNERCVACRDIPDFGSSKQDEVIGDILEGACSWSARQ